MSSEKTPLNKAAYLPSPKAKLLKIDSAPYTSPKSNEIVIKNGAVAINPVDWMMQTPSGPMVYPHLKYPFVVGSDVAGEVVEVGSKVKTFKPGDRVLGFALGTAPNLKETPTIAEGAFQKYTILRSHLVSHIPSSLTYEKASVIPLGLATAACGLFQKDQLALNHPSNPATKSTGETLLIWGGSTSVGTNAIQLAVSAGYEVLTTCSPKNFDYLLKLGAAQVFDYNSPTAIPSLITALKGKTVAGALSIGAGAAEACLEILSHSPSHCKKFIAMATYPMPQKPLKSFVLLQTILGYLTWNIKFWMKSQLKGVRSKFIFATTLADNEVGKMVFEEFLPKALEEGRFVASPEAMIVGTGLEFVQEGFEVQKRGVSARKVVVSL